MSTYTLPYFGEIELDKLDEFYDTEITINGKDISVNLTFDDTTIEKDQINAANTFLEKLETFDKQNQQYIINDFSNKNGDTVRYYLQYHLENLPEQNIAELVGEAVTGSDLEKQLLSKLQLVQVALYPHSEDYLAVFDYSLGENLTNHVVVISTDKDGNLHHMTMES